MLNTIKTYILDFEYLMVAIIFGIVNALMRPARTSLSTYVIEFVISVTTATLVGFVCSDMGFSDGLSYAATAIAAILARDIIVLIAGFGTFATNHKDALYMTIIRKLTGKEKDKTNGKKSVRRPKR